MKQALENQKEKLLKGYEGNKPAKLLGKRRKNQKSEKAEEEANEVDGEEAKRRKKRMASYGIKG